MRSFAPRLLAKRKGFRLQDVVLYEGPSLLTGAPIVVVLTGIHHASGNPKTGAMVQVWILRQDLPPQEARRQNLDDAICGDCELRGHKGRGVGCYVPAWMAPTSVWKKYKAGRYPVVGPIDAAERYIGGKHLRLSAYGDVAATPFALWPDLLSHVAGWVGYTHQWRTADPRFRRFLMASVTTVDDQIAAVTAGWRTFRTLAWPQAPLQTGFTTLPLNEFRCPASAEMGHKTTCETCQLCRGTESAARNVAIVAHGHHGVMATFHRQHPEGTRPVFYGRPKGVLTR